MDITAVNNKLVKEVAKLHQRKYRQDSGRFLLEGNKVISEAMNSGIEIEHLFVLEKSLNNYTFKRLTPITTSEAVLKKISTTDTPPDIVAVGIQPKYNLDKLHLASKVILLDRISDAGNLGTIIRSSVAFGIDAIILYGTTVDLYNPKCVRSAVGNLWKIDVYNFDDIKSLDKYFNNFERIATLPKSINSLWLDNWEPKEKTLVMFGAESDGLCKELKDYATENVTIEMSDNVESLNLSISAGIIGYKLGKNHVHR